MKLHRLSAIAIGLIAATCLSSGVMAADVTEAAPEGFDWTGAYVGGHAGWGWIDFKGAYDTSDEDPEDDFVDGGAGDFDLEDDGFLGGFQAGYNLQIDHFVLGIEGDISFVSWEDDQTSDDDPPERVSFDTDLLISLRARAGLAMDNLLFYATAGVAWTDTNFQADDDTTNNDADEEGDLDLDNGFVVGGGAEFAFDENWSVRAEGLYYAFDRESIEDLTDDTDEDDFAKIDDLFVVRAGLNFRF